MRSFAELREARDKVAVFTFGRFNPPTTGNEKLIEKLASVVLEPVIQAPLIEIAIVLVALDKSTAQPKIGVPENLPVALP